MSYSRRKILITAWLLTRNFMALHETHPSWSQSSVILMITKRREKADISQLAPYALQQLHPKIGSVKTAIESAPDVTKALKIIGRNLKTMSTKEVIHSIEVLYMLQKDSNMACKNNSFLGEPEFAALLTYLVEHLRELNVEKLVSVLKIILHFKVPVRSNLALQILKRIGNEANKLSLPDIDSVLHSLRLQPENHEIDQLKKLLLSNAEEIIKKRGTLNVIQAFLLSKTKKNIESEKALDSFEEAVSAFSICLEHKLSDCYIKQLANELKKAMNPPATLKSHQASAVIVSLALYSSYQQCELIEIRALANYFVQSMMESQDNWTLSLMYTVTENVIRINQSTRWLPVNNFLHTMGEFYLSNHCSFIEAIRLLNLYNRKRFVHVSLLDYIIQEATKEEKKLLDLTVSDFGYFVESLEIANYANQKSWDALRSLLQKRSLLPDCTSDPAALSLALKLAYLRIFPHPLLEKVFEHDHLLSTLKYVDQYTAARQLHASVALWDPTFTIPQLPDDFIKQSLLAWRNSIINCQTRLKIKQLLEDGFNGPSNVRFICATKLGFEIDFLLVITKHFTSLRLNTQSSNTSGVWFVEDVMASFDCAKIGICCFSKHGMQSNLKQIRGREEHWLNSLEAQGLGIIHLNLNTWRKALDVDECKKMDLKDLVFRKCEKIFNRTYMDGRIFGGLPPGRQDRWPIRTHKL